MSQITALLLIYMNEEDAFWALVKLLSGHRHAMHGRTAPQHPTPALPAPRLSAWPPPPSSSRVLRPRVPQADPLPGAPRPHPEEDPAQAEAAPGKQPKRGGEGACCHDDVLMRVAAAAGQAGGVHQPVHHEVVLPVLPGQGEYLPPYPPPPSSAGWSRDPLCPCRPRSRSPSGSGTSTCWKGSGCCQPCPTPSSRCTEVSE